MKEELQGKLVEILTSIQNATSRAADFALADLPDIAQQYLVVGRAFATIVELLLTVILGVLIWSCVWIMKNADEYEKPVVLLPGIAAIGVSVVWLTELKTLLMVWFAPKVWLITELAKLIK